MINEETIEVKNLTKKFELNKKNLSFLSKILLQKEYQKDQIIALRGISFSAKKGENIGIIGRNGSGKSTLLRILADIYLPTQGEIRIKGKVVYLSGFGHGLKPKLTMKENIFLMGSILGLGKKKIKQTFREIVEFSGLKEFTNVKVFKFSSGMIARLNFAIGINCLKEQDPEILLLDEVFSSGGDENFKTKIFEKVQEVMERGSTILMASHDLDLIKKYCKKVIWLEEGKIKQEGFPENILPLYKEYVKNKINI